MTRKQHFYHTFCSHGQNPPSTHEPSGFIGSGLVGWRGPATHLHDVLQAKMPEAESVQLVLIVVARASLNDLGEEFFRSGRRGGPDPPTHLPLRGRAGRRGTHFWGVNFRVQKTSGGLGGYPLGPTPPLGVASGLRNPLVVRACVHACARACVHTCLRACACSCVCVCVCCFGVRNVLLGVVCASVLCFSVCVCV